MCLWFWRIFYCICDLSSFPWCIQPPIVEKNCLFWILCIELIWYDSCCINVVFCLPIFSATISMRSMLNLSWIMMLFYRISIMVYWCLCDPLWFGCISNNGWFKLFYTSMPTYCDKWIVIADFTTLGESHFVWPSPVPLQTP